MRRYSGPVTTPRFAAALNAQIGNEFAAHLQYVAIAVHFDALTMPQMASFFYVHAREERDHAMMMVRYLLDTEAEVTIPGSEAPITRFDGVVEPIELSLSQERTVTEQVYALTRIAREENDYGAEQFMQWFIKEQVEEVAKMSSLLTVAKRNTDSIADLEAYVAGQQANGGGVDPTAPSIADA
ncbi:MAG: ferritin [Actinomycetales bacterium]|uniref:Ferritin n=1 Tax=Candidatus Phosphoribacter hodrii TaxID=2953743 RepID=A0A935CGQ8_9MICO|nr:ferritin [Candidatus Phosphoribacter hodrii]MBK7274296.1 ferritin [Candidatus Phosphoribacter hodrii]MBP8838189.1 ferritin [Dermatophilaceae bacterium]